MPSLRCLIFITKFLSKFMLTKRYIALLFCLFCLYPVSACSVVLNSNTTNKELKKTNIIIVQSDIDLNGKVLTLPKKAKLLFDGGSISNGKLIFNKTLITGEDVRIRCKVMGSVRNQIIYADWFIQDNDLDWLYQYKVWDLTGMKVIQFSSKEYILSVNSLTNGIKLNDVIVEGNNCAIKAKTGGSLVYSLLPFSHSKNVEIRNLKLVGSDEMDSYANARHNLALLGCEKITITNVTSERAYTDGLYIISCKDMEVDSFRAYTSGRQGCSIVSGENIRIKNCVFDGSYRFAPKSGLDIEPNYSEDDIDGILIENCSFTNNHSAGLTILLRTREANKPCNITVDNCIFKRNGINIAVSSAPNSGIGVIDIGNSRLVDSKGVSFQSKCYSAEGTPKVVFHHSILENANMASGNDVREFAAFVSVHNISSSPVSSNFGHIELRSLTIKQDEKLLKNIKRAISVYPDSQYEIEDVTISDISFGFDDSSDGSLTRMFVPQKRTKAVVIKP